MSEYIGNCPHCGQINPHKTDCHWSCFERNHELQSQLAAAQEELRKAQEEIEKLKSGRVLCSCGKDTANIRYAQCYNCRQILPSENEFLQTENARLRGILERIEEHELAKPCSTQAEEWSWGYNAACKALAAIAAEGKAK